MEITGKIIYSLPELSGESKTTGNRWRKKEYVLETFDSYPKKVHFDFFGERVDQFPLNIGDTIRLSFDIESREYNGRWYTSIRGWKAEPAQAPGIAGPTPVQNVQTAPVGGVADPPIPITPEPPAFGDSSDDLPF